MKLISVCFDADNFTYIGFEEDGSMWECSLNNENLWEWSPIPMADSDKWKIQK